ncbi:hypothetical protein CRG98_043659 [Punica granatum]|uniref:Uncharacterized protein n=1 Tax=Punica granatum TaxID=22663 RepID=A0A2I0HWQ3_PUNGR|nr:hypothetical protein CRG98_043659 [Punica granatum]
MYPKGTDPCAEKQSGRTRRGRTPEQKNSRDVPEGDGPLSRKVVGTYPKGCGACCPAGLQGEGVLPDGLHGAGKSSQDVPEGDGPLSRKVVGTYPKGLQYARGAYRMNNMVQWRLPNGLVGCGACCPAGCKVRGVLPGGLHGAGKSSQDVLEGDGPLSRKVVGTYPKGTDPCAEKVVGTYPKGTDPCAEKWSGRTRRGRTPEQKCSCLGCIAERKCLQKVNANAGELREVWKESL